MWIKQEPWQLSMLTRLASLDRERVETMLNTLFRSYPELYQDLVLLAVDQEVLSKAEAAERLDLSLEAVEERLALAPKGVPFDCALIHDPKGTRLAHGQVAVWEVVREYRKVGSVERLRSSFPSLSEIELAAALRYAEANPAEIEQQIEEFEALLAHRRAR